MKKLLSGLLLVACGISLIYYIQFTNKLHIERIVLRGESNFKITDETFEFRLCKLREKNYAIVLKFVTINESDANCLKKLMYTAGTYNVLTRIVDEKGHLIQSETIDDGSRMSGGWSQECVEWVLIRFLGDNGQNYKVQISFQGNDDIFDKLPKEIYMTEQYDPASVPWLYLLQRVFLITFVVLLAGLIIMIFLWRKNWGWPLRGGRRS